MKIKNRVDKTVKQHENRLAQDKKNKCKKKERLALLNIDEQLNRQDELTQKDSDKSQFPKADRKLLLDNIITAISITKILLKFSADNNMDPGDVSEELCNLTEIKEMLIARIFSIVSIYCLHSDQYAYRDGLINNQLLQIDDVEQCFNDNDDIYEDTIGSNFVSASLSSSNEE
ncbi:hypothetical protein C1646_762944 [Rhizophagus diaphanus]|nr:hypothetical protein C1646_762944 [Rhizophagus diaphanus] [Rhizophagus sp. MUCL 43196]